MTIDLGAFGYGQPGFGEPTKRGSVNFIARKDHFPQAVAGVITLPADTTWLICGAVDLEGDRIVCDGVATIVGLGQETCSLSSTGLTSGQIISTTTTLTLHKLTITSAGSAFGARVDGSAVSGDDRPACDWSYVNFRGGPGAYLINCSNAIMNTMGFFGTTGCFIQTAIDTFAVSETIFTPSSGFAGLNFISGGSWNRRIRVQNCAFAIEAGATGVSVIAADVQESEGYIVEFCNFAGAGTYTAGAVASDEASRWQENRGIDNSSRLGSLYMTGNATVTTITAVSTPVKVAGATTVGDLIQRFTATDNRLTYDSELTQNFTMSTVASVSGGTGDEIALYIYKNGLPINGHRTLITLNSAGRVENAVMNSLVELSLNDYVEVWISNETDTSNVTVEELHLQINAV